MKKGILLGVVFALLILGGGVWWWQKNQGQEKIGVEEKEVIREEERETGGAQLKFSVQERGEAESTGSGEERPLTDQEIQQLEQEIDQLLNDLNLEEEPELDFNL